MRLSAVLVGLAMVGGAALVASRLLGRAVDNSASLSTSPMPVVRQALSVARTPPPAVSEQAPKSAPDLCVLRVGAGDEQFTQFLNRYPFFGLLPGDLRAVVAGLRDTRPDGEVLPSYGVSQTMAQVNPAPSPADERHSPALPDTWGALTPEQRQASVALAHTYLPSTDSRYEYSETGFDAAVAAFMEVFRSNKQMGLHLLYRHAREASQHYWRQARTPQFNHFVHFEHWRQALIYWNLKYATDETLAEIDRDRALLPPVNALSQEPSRPYGAVMGERVETMKAKVRAGLRLDAMTPVRAQEPANLSDDEGFVAYQIPLVAVIEPIAQRAWASNKGLKLSELLQALSKECSPAVAESRPQK